MSELIVRYLLTTSVLRLTLSEYLSRNALSGREYTTYEGTAVMLEMADETNARAIHLPEWWSRADTTGLIQLRPDRRVSSIQATSTGRGPAMVKAALSVVGTVVGIAVATANPPLGLAITGAVRAVAAQRGYLAENVAEPSEAPELAAYRRQYPVECSTLVSLRTEMTKLSGEFTAGVDNGGATSHLEALDRRQRLVARHLQPFEDHHAAWLHSQTTKTLAGVHEVTIDVDRLPSRQQLLDTLAAQTHAPGGVDDSKQPWLKWAVLSELAVSVDVETGAAAGDNGVSVSGRAEDDDVLVEWRAAVPATVRTWSVTWIPEHEAHDPAGAEETVLGHYDAVVTDITHRRLVRRSAPSSVLRLSKGLFKSSKVTVSFNATGEPEQIGVDQSSQLADTVAAVPGALVDSLGQGSSIAAAAVPGSATAARLAQALAVAKNRSELSPLLTAPDENAATAAAARSSLQDAVSMAELEVRLQRAHAAQALPNG